MRTNLDWKTWMAVACLAALVAGAQCGHDSANDQSSEEKATSESTAEPEESSDEDEQGAPAPSEEESDMERADVQRIANPDVERSALETLVADNTAFGLELFQALRDPESEENLFFAPYNLSHVLAMTLTGARGETRAEMRDALQFELEDPQLHAAFNMLDAALVSAGSEQKKGPGDEESEEKPDVLQTANGLWAQKGFALREPFLETLAKHYGTGVRPVDFANASEEARKRINEWAANQTNDKIQDLLPSGAVDARTRLILTAAIYFRASWESTFDEEDTEENDFENLSGETATVEMMHQKLRKGYRFASGSNYKAVELPYASGAFSMVVILPDEGAFSDVESKLDAEFTDSVFESLEGEAVALALPKFELSGRFSASSALGKLGMKRPFQQDADFAGMTEETDLMIDDVLHEAYVSVDEEGTEAAAASATVMRATSMPAGEPEYREVTVDRPFLFMIRHTGTDSVLFLGRVVDL